MNTSLASAEFADASDATTPMPYVATPPAVLTDAVNDGKWRTWSSTLRNGIARIQHWARALGPYVVIELLLPGGTIIALVLWAFRQRRAASAKVKVLNSELPVAEPRVQLRCLKTCGQQ